MAILPKPQPCGQNWLAMTSTANGRQCGQCDKEIYDFSAMSWPEIEQTQATQGKALCGMYSAAQLAHWGQPPPSACSRLAAATALAFALSIIQVQGQTPPTTATRLTLRGTVSTSTQQGAPEPVAYATVLVAGTNLGVATDEQGHYELVLPDSMDATRTITFSFLGLQTSTFTLPTPRTGLLQHDVLLTVDTTVIAFSVRKPSLFERAKWTLRRWLD